MRFSGKIYKDGGFWLAEIPILDVTTQGHTRKEALEMAVDMVETMPIRLAQVHLILQDSRDHRPDHRSSIQTHPKDYKIAPEAGSSRLIRERMLKLQQSRRVT